MKKNILFIAISLLLVLTACGSNGTTSNDKQEIKLGIMGDSLAWKHVKEELAKDGITLTIVSFSDYPQVNAALHNKDVDLNAFQHQAYLDKENEELGYDIVSIAKTYIAPLGIYSKNVTDISQVKDGDSVAIPNDVTNGGRALKLLESAGLITLADVKIPTLKDITANPKNLEIKELSAASIPSVLQDVAIAAINSGISTDAGLSLEKDAIFLEEASLEGDNPYINIIAANKADKDNPLFQKALEKFFTDEVKELIIQDSKGSTIPVW